MQIVRTPGTGTNHPERVIAPSLDPVSSDALVTREATTADADEVARLLHDFNEEFDTPSPGATVLAGRLRELLGRDETIAIVAGVPAVGVALITLRSNVWYDGPVALLDELYVVPERRSEGIGSRMLETMSELLTARGVELVEINVDEGDVEAQRFYVRHGFSDSEPDTGERAFYFFRESSAPGSAMRTLPRPDLVRAGPRSRAAVPPDS